MYVLLCIPHTPVSTHVKWFFVLQKNDNEAKYIRDKVVEKRRELFKANEAEVGRRWAFEEGVSLLFL